MICLKEDSLFLNSVILIKLLKPKKMKRFIFLTTLLLLCSFGLLQSQNCPNNISSFTYLGQLDGHRYFLSEDGATPIAAQNFAQSVNGYLVKINTEPENEFLEPFITEMTYIGLNDAQSEGALIWTDGDAVGYENFDFCSFCLNNEDDYDYVVMHSWDGNWSFSSGSVARPYIIEVPCGTIQGIDITVQCSDDFPQDDVWNIPITVTNNTSETQSDLQLSLRQEREQPNYSDLPPVNNGEINVPILAPGASVDIILPADPGSISFYLPNRTYLGGTGSYGTYFYPLTQYFDHQVLLTNVASGQTKKFPVEFYCKKYETDLVVYLQNPIESYACLLYTSPSPRDQRGSRMPSSA